MTNVYSNTQYSIKRNPNVRMKIWWATTSVERKIKYVMWPRVPENALFIFLGFFGGIVIYSSQLQSSRKEVEEIISISVANQTLIHSSKQDYFSFCLQEWPNLLILYLTYSFSNSYSIIRQLPKGDESALCGLKGQPCHAK